VKVISPVAEYLLVFIITSTAASHLYSPVFVLTNAVSKQLTMKNKLFLVDDRLKIQVVVVCLDMGVSLCRV
jgi:hypothetical protein